MKLPRFESYGQYASSNYGAHSLVFHVGELTVYFSYQTPVAFRVYGNPAIVRENDWGPTTGKHLNWIDGGSKESKAQRLSGEDFEQRLAELVAATVPA